MIRRFTAFALLFALIGCPGRAGSLTLDYQGMTYTLSSLNRAPIAQGTDYTIQSIFSTPGVRLDQGVGDYSVTSITAVVGGKSYSEQFPVGDLVILFDPSNPTFPGHYVANLIGPNIVDFSPYYTASSDPAWSATNPTPTFFPASSYAGSLGDHLIKITTASDLLFLDYNPNSGISAAISAVPEASSLVLMGIAALAGASFYARRRRPEKGSGAR
jgi:hypothetical protein